MKRKKRHPPHWLYFLMENKEIVYIGVTCNLTQRMRGHTGKTHNHVRVTKFDSKYVALDYERRWIRRFKPKYNKPIPMPWEYYQNTYKGLTCFVSKEKHAQIKQMAQDQGVTISDFLYNKIFTSTGQMRTKEKEKSLSVLIGEADKVFSEYIRYRDMKDGKISCFICGTSLRFSEAQNMHFMGRGLMTTRFDEMNCHAGCQECNCMDANHFQHYIERMWEKYGKRDVERLVNKSQGLQKFMRYEVEELITHYKSKVSELKKV